MHIKVQFVIQFVFGVIKYVAKKTLAEIFHNTESPQGLQFYVPSVVRQQLFALSH